MAHVEKYPESKLLPSAEQQKAAAMQISRSKARERCPDFRFKRHKLDLSRLRVRRYLVEDSSSYGNVKDADEANSIEGRTSMDNISVVDVKLPRYSGQDGGEDNSSHTECDSVNTMREVDDEGPSGTPDVHWNGKPIIRHDMTQPMLSMRELTTLGLGGKAGPYHPPLEEKPKDGLATTMNNAMRNDIDKAFSTDKAKLIAEANKADIALDGVEVYYRVGDHYVLENKSAMSRRSDFDEESLSLGRQRVKVKLKRHRGALGLDKFHFSRKNKLTLESKTTKRERRIERHGKKALKASLSQVQAIVDKIKEEEDAKAEAQRREMHRQGQM